MKFNTDLIAEVRRVRRANGENPKAYNPVLHQYVDSRTGRISNHPLESQKVVDKTTGETWTIEQVGMHWYYGYYYHVLLIHDVTQTSTAVTLNVNSIKPMLTVNGNADRFNLISGKTWRECLWFSI